MNKAKSQKIGFLDFSNAEKARKAGARQRVFDWDKAAKLIKESNCQIAEAGLASDWDNTGGVIYDNGPVYDDYTYLSSNWAAPYLIVDGNEIACWCYSDEWDANTKWPDSALKILNSEKISQISD